MEARPTQEPVAVIGYACRLPGGNTNPHKLWQFLERGGIASNKVPSNRFNIAGHWDGSHKPRTMRPMGGMFLEGIDLADFDASFFEMSRVDAISMDPNQRQMLEVVYECLENAGLRLEDLNGAPVGCFVGSFASDYADMQGRDPENRPANITVGVGRAILANRLSHFFNVKGPSVTVDTACSGSLIGLDIACRYLQSGEINGAIISTSNLYLNPEHVTDLGAVGNAHSPTGLCHTFDIAADGYVKAEAVGAVFVKRLDDAIRDGDPIRGIIRGSSTNSDGRTPGIASPSAEAQAVAIRMAYERAGITDVNATTYLECHGTGTQAGDPTEVGAASSILSKTRSENEPLLIGSIKSNVGHAEPAAGISGLIKVLLSMEKGIIPGNPTFENPSPKIDFAGWKVKASRTAIPWPKCAFRRASVNSFGYGGSNVHLVVDQPAISSEQRHVSSYIADDDDFDFVDAEATESPQVLLLSANDATSLQTNIRALTDHLVNPRVKVQLPDLAYTLSERRSKLFHRAFLTAQSSEIEHASFVTGKGSTEAARIGFIFTGQGAQWPQMGHDLLKYFPWTREILEELNNVLQSLPEPPQWSLVDELTQPRSAQHLRQPEFSQPLVTALQICIVAVLERWGVMPQDVVGHSSGEIAAAYAAGLLSRADAIKAAFYRGRAAVNCQDQTDQGGVGMLAVGIGFEALEPLLQNHSGSVWVACYNSPRSLTLSGRTPALTALKSEIEAAGHFARLLQVDLAYHSELMGAIGIEYHRLLATAFNPLPGTDTVSMWSSVSGQRMTEPADAAYWKANMVSPVLFDTALKAMISKPEGPNFLVEIGPSGALAGPVSQIRDSLPTQGSGITYCPAWSRGTSAAKTIFDLAGRLFIAGHPVDMPAVNQYATDGDARPKVIVDLPNYVWNHTTKYWHENESSRDWRFKPYVHHDLLGSKILGTSWASPSWRKMLNIADVPWLNDHKMGSDVLMPGSGYITMAVEALYQKSQQTQPQDGVASPSDLSYRLRNVRFDKALVLQDGQDAAVMLTLWRRPGDKEEWHEFRISSTSADVVIQHCTGLIRLQDRVEPPAHEHNLAPLKFPSPGHLWYKAQAEVGYGFGPAFQRLLEVESMSGQRHSRATVSLTDPDSKWHPQSQYPIHPAALDGCFQTVTPALWAGERCSMNAVVVPSMLDHLVINKCTAGKPDKGVSVATSEYSGRGRLDEGKSYLANCSVYDAASGSAIMEMRGLRFAKLDLAPKPDPHTFDQILWKPDITFLTQDQLGYLDHISIDGVIDLIGHKFPALTVLEVDLFDAGDEEATSSYWFARGDGAARAGYTAYSYASHGTKRLVSVQTQWDEKPNTSFALLNLNAEHLGLPPDRKSDLVILKVGSQQDSRLGHAVEGLRPLIAPGGRLLIVQPTAKSPPADEVLQMVSKSDAGSPSDSEDPTSSSDPGDSLVTSLTPPSSASPTIDVPASELGTGLRTHSRTRLQKLAVQFSLGNLLEMESDDGHVGSLFTAPEAQGTTAAQSHELYVARLDKSAPSLTPGLRSILERAGWNITEHTCPFHSLPSTGDGVILVLDELASPLLSRVNAAQWDGLKTLVGTRHRLLWVTKGAQHHRVTVPENALAPGLFRVMRMEDAAASLSTLDVQSSTSPAAAAAIDQVLRRVRAAPPAAARFVEFEYAERDGVLHVQRVVPDAPVNRHRRAEREGHAPVVRGLFGADDVPVALRAERLGTLESLTWAEQAVSEPVVEEGKVEVDVVAVGVNFKDVAVTMGIIPENEYTLGYEAAGVVKRLGPGVTKFEVGDRVCFLCNGSYANRLQVPVGRAHVIPSSMTFEDAATIPSVYLASVYSLFDLANLQRGKSVLIHSAAGGVGISCIQLCQYMGAEIYVTVGTDEKRQFLTKTYGLPPNRIFSSRNTDFSRAILDATHGRGIDIIINSLTGEMLDESWRICADGGTMVEIGKKDIVDRNTLSMEPFERNCSFRAMDFSYTKDISDTLISRLLDQIFDLVAAGHIGPVHPITTFGFNEIPAALSHIRSGLHIGKVVISGGRETDVQVPIRPAVATLQLRPDLSYLIVGGLRGLCGNLAVYMARQGARHISVASRSGLHDVASQKIVQNCLAYGCHVSEARGDICDANFVRKIFKETSPPIGGVIQGAMILKDKPFELMTADEYHAAIHAKVRGTWNLHNASMEQRTPLEFFTLLSSISGIVGKKGQSNYSAANTFLDAFAGYRRGLGLRAHAVDLGLIEDIGYVAEQGGMDQHFDKRQWTPILEGTLRSILRCSVLEQTESPAASHAADASRTQLVTGVGFPLPDDSGLVREARFAYLFSSSSLASAGGGAGASNKEGGGAAEQLLRSFRVLHQSHAEAAALVREAVAVLGPKFAAIMRLDGEMEPAKPLMAYGVDSLAAVELRNWVRLEFKVEMTSLEITNATSLTALGEKLVARLPAA